MIQHNPHSHSILCASLGRTLDGFEARELDAAPGPCAGCQCRLIDEAPAPARALEPEDVTPEPEPGE